MQIFLGVMTDSYKGNSSVQCLKSKNIGLVRESGKPTKRKNKNLKVRHRIDTASVIE